MTQKLLTLPLRAGIGATRLAFGITTKLAETAIELARRGPGSASPSGSEPGSSAQRRSEPRGPAEPRSRREPQAPVPPQRPPEAHAPPPAPLAPAPPEPPPAPTEAAEPIDDEPELVGEFAEPGAEDGAGAQLRVDEPWEGYSELRADAVIERLADASAAEVAVVELYEGMHRQRETVLAAAERRLRAAARPGG